MTWNTGIPTLIAAALGATALIFPSLPRLDPAFAALMLFLAYVGTVGFGIRACIAAYEDANR